MINSGISIKIETPRGLSVAIGAPGMAVSLGSQIARDSTGQDVYRGEYVVIPMAFSDQTLETSGKLLLDDVKVTKVPYYETSNVYDGKTVFIAGEVNDG